MDFVSILLTLFFFPFGFFTLFKGAEFLVEGASAMAKKLNASDILIGLTIVALGTSLPELFINLLANLEGASDLAVGNIIGSNMTTILLVLGICSVLYPLSVTKETVFREIPLLFAITIILFLLGNDQYFNGYTEAIIGRRDGMILIALFIFSIYYTFVFNKAKEVIAQIGEEKISEDEQKLRSMSVTKCLSYILIGCLTLPIGAQMVVQGSLTVANFIGLSEHFVGLTIVALGTTTPELITSIVATKKGNFDLAIGNIVGSNLLNILFILGISAIVRPIQFNTTLNADLGFYFGAVTLLFLFLAVKNHEDSWWRFIIRREQHVLSKTEGIVFILYYLCFIGFLLWRE
ncbi:MAG: calcium/sodium antiporter [Candidatus Altimarinota bacterium]